MNINDPVISAYYSLDKPVITGGQGTRQYIAFDGTRYDSEHAARAYIAGILSQDPSYQHMTPAQLAAALA